MDWRGADSTLRYGESSAYGSSVAAYAPDPLPFSSGGPFREARIDGLTPGTTYHYAIGDGDDHIFRTSPAPGSGFTVYVEGDIGDSQSYPRVTPVQSLIADGNPDFVLVVGDLTYADDQGLAAVDRHFNDVMVWSQDAAYMPVWGNHDWNAPDDLRNYKGRFLLPNAQSSPGAPSAGCCGEDWSWFDYGSVRFLSYPEPYSGAWSDWSARARVLMDEAQADTSIRFIVTFGHRPAYSSGHHEGSATLAGILGDLASSHPKYVLNLNGHSHNYERSYPQSGVIHVTVGIGGSSLEQEDGSCPWLGGCPAPSWSAYRAFHHGALRLRFEARSIRGEAICGPPGDGSTNRNDITCAPGDVFDSFTIGGDSAPEVVAPARESGRPGTPIVIHVSASDPDGEPIHSLSADLSDLPGDNGALFTASAGDTSGVLSWTPGPADTGTFTITFHADNALSGTTTTLVLVSDSLQTAPPPGGAIFALESARPNPARSDLSVVYSLSDGEPARLELIGAAGQILLRRDLGSPGPGRHTFLLGRTPEVAPGVYWLRLTQARHTQAAKIAFLR